MARKKKNVKDGINRNELKEQILELFKNRNNNAFNYKQVCKRIGIREVSEKHFITQILEEMAANNEIEEIYPGKYRLKSRNLFIEGTLEIMSGGFYTVKTKEFEDVVTILPRNLKNAVYGDYVRVSLSKNKRADGFSGRVAEILRRNERKYVGTIEMSKNFAFVAPEGKNIPFHIFIPPGKLNNAKHGQKVIVAIDEWNGRNRNPVGKVIEIIGRAGEKDTEMISIMAEYQLPVKFPEEVNRAAGSVVSETGKDEIKSRRDFRGKVTFTIDPEDAKDFDDAVSIYAKENGRYEIGVHIADVSHYVKKDSVIDREAYSRATSVYLVDRVVPMLPEILSNEICSLKPDEDKLCFSAVFEMNENAEIMSEWFGKTIIRSLRRFNYDEAEEIIERKKGDLCNEIFLLNNLAQKLRKERFKRGSIGFDKVEVKFKLDSEGKPESVYYKENKNSNKLIEEFMLLANRRVAEFIGKRKKNSNVPVFVYRVHDKPDKEKMESLANFVKIFGYNLNLRSGKAVSASLNQLIEKLEGSNEKNLIENVAIRAMAKAEYSTDNIGHFGLGFPYYTHFTSPIRRYPDLMVHRLLYHYLANGKSVNQGDYESKCVHSSKMEQLAAEAERASVKYMQIEFMKDKIGEIFDGVISGLTEWGMYLEIIQNKCEGMVSLKEIDDDYYVFDEKNFRIYGKRTGKQFRLGDNVTIRIFKINFQKRFIDFVLVD